MKKQIFFKSWSYLIFNRSNFIIKADLNLIKNLDFNKGDLSMVVAMFSWAIYSALLKSKKYEISQMSLLEVVIICGLVF